MISMFSISAGIAGVFMLAPIELSVNVRAVCTFIYCISIVVCIIADNNKRSKIINLSKKINELETKIGVLERKNKTMEECCERFKSY